MLLLEIILTILFYIFLPVYALERVIHKKSRGWKEKFGFCDSIDGKVIMIHGCSVGEINAVEDLAKEIKSKFPEYKLVMTTSTVTGQDVAKKKYANVADYITYFPFDTIFETRRFLNKINPSLVFIMETEIWPCFSSACKEKNIPLYIINGRLSDKSFGQYKLFKPYFKGVLSNYTKVFTQSDDNTNRFISIGVSPDKVQYMGNLKLDVKRKNADINIGQEGYRVLVAGSTHTGENEIVLSVYKKLISKFNDIKLIIAPRHIEKADKVEKLCAQLGLKYARRSKDAIFSPEVDVIILDTLGELGKIYSICHIAYIGGSLCKTGGHNPLEASIWDKPVVSGDNVSNFKDVYKILVDCNAAKIVTDENSLYNAFWDILENSDLYDEMSKACSEVFEKNSGSKKFITDEIEEQQRNGVL